MCRAPTGCGDPRPDGRRDEHRPAGQRCRRQPAVRHPCHPGHPDVDRARPRRPDGLARRAPRRPPRGGDRRRPPRSRRRWTVGALAAEAAMSRSAFAARFTELVGEPAMQYVSRWRMHHAAELLADDGISVSEAGRLVGYDSEAAFSRAFTRVIGAPPSTIRASGRSDAALVGLGLPPPSHRLPAYAGSRPPRRPTRRTDQRLSQGHRRSRRGLRLPRALRRRQEHDDLHDHAPHGRGGALRSHRDHRPRGDRCARRALRRSRRASGTSSEC